MEATFRHGSRRASAARSRRPATSHASPSGHPSRISTCSAPARLAVAGILILFTLASTWLAVIAGLSAKTVDGASAFSYPLIFLPFVSSAFVPTDTMPGPVRAFAKHQPVTSIVDAIRELFAQRPVGADIWIALAWCVGLLVVAQVFAMVTYRRRIS
ncbi:MAG: ABC transporter permease [Trueperaceae bacterium]